MIETAFKESNVFSPFPYLAKILGIQDNLGASLCWLYIATAGAKVTSRDICLHLVVRKNCLVFPRLDFLGRQ